MNAFLVSHERPTKALLTIVILAAIGGAVAQSYLLPILKSRSSIRAELVQNPEASYLDALRIQDAAQRASALDEFVAHYPDRPLKVAALQEEIVAYRQVADLNKASVVANRLLQINEDDVLALAVVVSIERSQGGSVHGMRDLQRTAERALKALNAWKPPEGMSEAAFQQLRSNTAAILYGGAGFAALQMKDFTRARNYYLKAVECNSNDFMNVYQLGVAELETKPPDLNGLWYVAKAASLVPLQYESAKEAILHYGQEKYREYERAEQGWNTIVSAVASEKEPPEDFAKKLKEQGTT